MHIEKTYGLKPDHWCGITYFVERILISKSKKVETKKREKKINNFYYITTSWEKYVYFYITNFNEYTLSKGLY